MMNLQDFMCFLIFLYLGTGSKELNEYPASIYLFKFNIKNTRTMCEIWSKLTIKTPERRHWSRSGVFIVNYEQISHIVLLFPSLTLNN